jgi:hypothetical protein
MADELEADKPWAEMHWAERLWTVCSATMGVVFVGALAVVLLVAAVNETRWTFTHVRIERICKAGQHGDCLLRTPGLVKSVDDLGFTIAIDRPPYTRHITALSDPSPRVGARVVTEDWHGRLVSVVDPEEGRRHTDQWPSPAKDAAEALLAWGVLLFIPTLVGVSSLGKWRKRRRLRSAGVSPVPREHTQPS